ncbi:MAG: glycosyltransferase family 29 protein [bacterium]|nr:glycosyltransferase family 29 protein [bacterium]
MKTEIKWTTPKLYLQPKVAIIGSSSNVLDRDFGKMIDQYDEVIRFNRAPVEGYEEHVGSKTTVRVVNQGVFRSVPYTGREGFNNQPAEFIKQEKNITIVCCDEASHWMNHVDEYGLDESCAVAYLSRSHARIPKNDKVSTVGMAMVYACVESGIVPHLYGFGVNEGAFITHYFEDRDPNAPCHSYSREREFLLDLKKEEKLNIFY